MGGPARGAGGRGKRAGDHAPQGGWGTRMDRTDVEVAIVGGGIAGLWIANLLLGRGVEVALCDDGQRPSQTGAAQGIIHTGAKYALDGALGAARAIAPMAARWRRCLHGHGEIDLRGVPVLAPNCHLWVPGAPAAGAVAALAKDAHAIEAVRPADHPAPFAGAPGTLLRLRDFVIDVPALCRRLALPLAGRCLKMPVAAQHIVMAHGAVRALRDEAKEVRARRFVFAAGAGNGALAAATGHSIPTQRRPLQQVIARHPDPAPIFAHCLDGGARPALTITTHDGCHVIGGAVAEVGATRSQPEQVAAAQRALAQALPGVDWRRHRYETLHIDRAEPRAAHGRRPDRASAVAHGNVLTVWPVKLTLAPQLGDLALKALAA